MYFADVYTLQLTKKPGPSLEMLIQLARDEITAAFPEVKLEARRVAVRVPNPPALWLMVPDQWAAREFREHKEQAKEFARETLRSLNIISPHGEKTVEASSLTAYRKLITSNATEQPKPEKTSNEKRIQRAFNFDD